MIFKAGKLLLVLCLCCTAAPIAADTVNIREWLVPWQKSGPANPYVGQRGRVWFVGRRGDYVANFSPQTEEFNRYDLQKGTAPFSLLVDASQNIWFSSSRRRHIGMLDPATGRVSEIEMPDRKAKDPRTLVFDLAGNIWFTVADGNFIGKLSVVTREVELIALPARNLDPYGVVIDSRGRPWAAASGKNVLLSVDPARMTVTAIETPDPASRLRRIVTTSQDTVWYTDYELGSLGRYDPAAGQFREWPMPGGADSKPFAMTVDRDDRIWIVETGRLPNRLIGFDSRRETFLTETDIPSGADSIDHLYYDQGSGEVWFGSESNYVGRAVVH